jgi:CDP-diacylglycerol--serine O-phosphatidyltransferase
MSDPASAPSAASPSADAIKPTRRGVYLLPNLITTGSLFAGFLGILWATNNRFEACAMAILVSALLDGLDGKIARWTRSSSEFGVQYDSLADLVAFGVSPAFILYQWKLNQFGRLGLMACFLFMACGALRLARFNVQSANTSKKFFVGLPIPAAGCTVACLILAVRFFPAGFLAKGLPMACLVLTYLLSFLMVSRVRYASFKEYGALRAHPFSSMVSAILLFVLIASQPRLLGFIFFIGYVISGPIYTFFIMPRRVAKLAREGS